MGYKEKKKKKVQEKEREMLLLLKIVPWGSLSESSSLSYHAPHPTHTRSVAKLGRSQLVLHENPGSTSAHSSQTEA